MLEETILLGQLVDDLRTLSLAESGQLSLDRERIDLGPLAEQAAAAFEPLAEAEGIRLIVDADDGLPAVSADPARMQQVMGNLLSNAMRYAGMSDSSQPEIRLRIKAASGAIRVSISDNGPGLPAETRKFIFERFWRADTARSREQGGTGLGLAICQGIVLAHGGRIWVESSAGQGATFTFTLPLSVRADDSILSATYCPDSWERRNAWPFQSQRERRL